MQCVVYIHKFLSSSLCNATCCLHSKCCAYLHVTWRLPSQFRPPSHTICVSHVSSHLPGSLIVSLVLEGTTSGVTSALSSVCHNIANGTTLTYGGTTLTFSPYMSVNGASYYGVTCGSQATVRYLVDTFEDRQTDGQTDGRTSPPNKKVLTNLYVSWSQ